jgi:transcription antitermination protein NusB
MSAARKDSRRRGRESALQILYQCEIGRLPLADAVTTFFDRQWAGPDAVPEDIRAFGTQLAADTMAHLTQVDALIAETSERWRPERMAVLDRLILRMAVTELLRGAGTPVAVVINEALELARTFSTEDAVKFINGMLDGVRKKIETTR